MDASLGRVGEIRFAFLSEPPFCFRAADGAVTGCDVELARHVLHEVGIGSFTLVETEFAELLPGLNDGRWDMTTGLFITSERQEFADFSKPIWELPDGLIVRSDNPYGIDGYLAIAQQRNMRLAVVSDQVQHGTALRLGIGESQIVVFGTYVEAAAAVANRTVDAFASVAMAHRGYLSLNPAKPLTTVEVPQTEKVADQGAFAFSKSQSMLRRKVDRALSNYLGSARHRDLMASFGVATAKSS